MPTPTYKPLANITLGSSAASVTFSSISQAYRDLILIVQSGTTGGADMSIRLNSDSGSNYNWVQMYGTGSGSGTSNAFASQNHFFDYGTPTTLDAMMTVQLQDYSATDKHKSVLARRDWAAGLTLASAGRWASTSAVTALQVYAFSGSFIAGSSFALYGVAA